MKKVLKFLCSRLVIVTLAILVQFCFLLFIVLKLSTYGLYAYVSLQLISLVVVLWIVTKRDNPSYKIAWIIAILIFPFFGGIFYLVFGNKTMDKKQAQRIRDYAYKQVEESHQVTGADIGESLEKEAPHLKRQSDYISNVGLYPIWKILRWNIFLWERTFGRRCCGSFGKRRSLFSWNILLSRKEKCGMPYWIL